MHRGVIIIAMSAPPCRGRCGHMRTRGAPTRSMRTPRARTWPGEASGMVHIRVLGSMSLQRMRVGVDACVLRPVLCWQRVATAATGAMTGAWLYEALTAPLCRLNQLRYACNAIFWQQLCHRQERRRGCCQGQPARLRLNSNATSVTYHRAVEPAGSGSTGKSTPVPPAATSTWRS